MHAFVAEGCRRMKNGGRGGVVVVLGARAWAPAHQKGLGYAFSSPRASSHHLNGGHHGTDSDCCPPLVRIQITLGLPAHLAWPLTASLASGNIICSSTCNADLKSPHAIQGGVHVRIASFVWTE